MSGIVGIYNFDGAPVSRECLVSLTESLRYRGPDSQKVWCDFEVGFGHALLDTTGGRTIEEQPCSLDGEISIVADARLDAKGELTEKLRSCGVVVPPGASDGELTLLAYCAWGGGCLQHLLGDFAFAIWNKPQKQLFCARDHFGIKPFYYASVKGSFIFSNTLNCVRLHPQVSSQLNDLAIADYLLLGSNQDPSTTSFEQIRRLPPAHSLLCSGGKVICTRYWTIPEVEELRYKKSREYVENLRAVLHVAVQDRLPDGPVAVSMSGGLDSSTVAAVAGRVLGEACPSNLRAYTVVYDSLIPDQERRYAGLVADFCGIPIHYLAADNYRLFQGWRNGHEEPTDPRDLPLRVMEYDFYSQIAQYSRVLLTGQGGDPSLVGSPEAVVKLLASGKLLKLGSAYLRCAFWQWSTPRVGLRTLLRERFRASQKPTLPAWFNPELGLKLNLSERAAELEREPRTQHRRSDAYNKLSRVFWPNGFELTDPGNAPVAVEQRHPFFDLRVVKFLLSLPTLPWCVGKQILREAMFGFLPKEVLRRRKAPLAGDPVLELLKQPQSDWIDSFQPSPHLLHYVIRSRIPPVTGDTRKSYDIWPHLRPLMLDRWLRRQVIVGYKGQSGALEITTGQEMT